MALAELARIDQTLSQMAEWLDEAGEERAAVLLEDAWKAVLAAGSLIERDTQAAGLVHRRTGNAHDA
jgi:cell division protein YceG involved in septum cleavage